MGQSSFHQTNSYENRFLPTSFWLTNLLSPARSAYELASRGTIIYRLLLILTRNHIMSPDIAAAIKQNTNSFHIWPKADKTWLVVLGDVSFVAKKGLGRAFSGILGFCEITGKVMLITGFVQPLTFFFSKQKFVNFVMLRVIFSNWTDWLRFRPNSDKNLEWKIVILYKGDTIGLILWITIHYDA